MTDKTINDVYSDLSKVVNSTYLKIVDRILVKSRNKIVLFNKYVFVPVPDGVRVITRTTHTELEFGSIKSAFTWAILDHSNRVGDSSRVIELDNMISSIDAEILLHRNLKKTCSFDRYTILSNKISSCIDRRIRYHDEMLGLINKARTLSAPKFKIS